MLGCFDKARCLTSTASTSLRDEGMQTEHRIRRSAGFLRRGFPPWIGPLALATLVAILYFLGADLGLALLTQPDGVAVFWPAAGISAGMLVAFGPQARWPVTVGVMIATVLANLLSDVGAPIP